jgi:mannose-6-phosphate isomerase-like protein (cupin superfamily)
MIRREEARRVDNARGGEGSVYFYDILGKDELMGHGSLYARVVIPPHCSIGVHFHEHNTEPYYILSGEGVFTDVDGSRTRVTAGDICTIPVGTSHGLANEGEEDLVIMALIINEPGGVTE